MLTISKSKLKAQMLQIFRQIEESGEEWAFEEGCLSIPNVREDVLRKPKIMIEYYDEKFVKHIDHFDGMNARVIQHEYDHIEGILFTDHIKPLKKKLLHNHDFLEFKHFFGHFQ